MPVDRDFIVAGLIRLASAAEALTLTRRTANPAVLSEAHRIRREIRRLRQLGSDAPEITKQRWNAFVATARLIADVSRDLGTRGASDGVLDALTTAADGLDYDSASPPKRSIHCGSGPCRGTAPRLTGLTTSVKGGLC